MSELKSSTESVENYLKAIYQLEGNGQGAATLEIAARVGVSASGVSKMLRHLEKQGLVRYSPYHDVHLTEAGARIALEIIRHHRLLELYLMQSLGYEWDQVHAEAERLEHHISEEFESRMELALGFPAFDPHGDPIPTRDGKVSPAATITLESQECGARVQVRRVTDEDEALLRYLGERGLRPGVTVEILDRELFGGPLRLQIGQRQEQVSPEAARHVFVEQIVQEPVSEGSHQQVGGQEVNQLEVSQE